jgi:hypothetical protein
LPSGDGRSTLHVRKCCDHNSLERSCVGGLLVLLELLATLRTKIPTGRSKTDGIALIGHDLCLIMAVICALYFCLQHTRGSSFVDSGTPTSQRVHRLAISRPAQFKVIQNMVGRCKELMVAVTFWDKADQRRVRCMELRRG